MTEAGAGPVVVTGGTGGIGLGIAHRVVASGRPVTVLGRNADRCAAAARTLSAAAGSEDRVLALAVDTTTSAAGRFDDGIPAGRWSSPQDVAHAVLPLLSAAASWTTGAVLHVDGGYTAV